MRAGLLCTTTRRDCLHAKASRRPAAATRAANTMSTITVELTIKMKTKFIPSNAEKTNGFIAAPPGGSVHCVYHAKGSAGQRRPLALSSVLRLPCNRQAATRAAAPRRGSVLRLPRKRQLRASGGHARRSSSFQSQKAAAG